MDYQKHYNLIIERARNRLLEGYVETHHVVPKCMGGDDSKDNLVDLTAEEHYVAHQLLVKMYPGHHGLLKAVRLMAVGNKRGSLKRPHNKLYGWIKRHRMPMSEEQKAKIGRANKGRKHSEERKKAISAFHRGKVLSEETKAKMRKPKSPEMRAKLSASRTGKKFPRSVSF